MTTAAAIRLLASSLGLKVFPCLPGTKIPAVAHGFKASEEEIKEAFTKFPEAPIALVSGSPSGGVVGIDLETEEVANQVFEKFDALRRETWCIRTPHLGYVVLVRAVDKIPQRKIRVAGEQHPVDIAGEGGYFLVWGAIDHAKCDPTKARCPHSGVSNYETVSDCYTIMSRDGIEQRLERRFIELGWKTNDKKWPGISEVSKGTAEGSRNRAAFVMARYILFTMKMNPPDALAALNVWNSKNTPPLPNSELEAVLQSARKYPKAKRWHEV